MNHDMVADRPSDFNFLNLEINWTKEETDKNIYDIGPGSRVFFYGQNPWGRGLVLKRKSPHGFFWVRWPKKNKPCCEAVASLTRDLSVR